MTNNIYLIGMMGSGKSTIGEMLTRRIYYAFIDADDFLVERSDFKSINEIFSEKNEDYFRLLEKSTMKELSTVHKTVVATGGGVILKDENIKMMKASGVVIYLNSSIDTLVNRLKGSNNRPLLKDADLKKKLEGLYKARKEKYSEASDISIDIGNKEKEVIVDEIIKILAGEYNEYISD